MSLGWGMEISIKGLMNLIARLTGFEEQVVLDETKPDGQPPRKLDTNRAKQEFGFEQRCVSKRDHGEQSNGICSQNEARGIALYSG